MASYEQAFKDWDYLWKTYAPANDMTGGYVDQEDLARLLKSPTKATAAKCLTAQISYWFEVGPDGMEMPKLDDDARLLEIAERYGAA